MKPSKAVILMCHGSRDPQWLRPFEAIRDAVAARHDRLHVRLACLQFVPPSLETTVEALAQQHVSNVTVVPMFMSRGGHVARDVDAKLQALRSTHPTMTITIGPTIGELPGVQNAIANAIGTLVEAPSDNPAPDNP